MNYYHESTVENYLGQAKNCGAEIHKIDDDLTVVYGRKVGRKTGIITRVKTEDARILFRPDEEVPDYIYKIRQYNDIPDKYAKMINIDDGVNYCKYCGSPTDSVDEDVLCEECRDLFGHTFYSEL